MNRGKIFFLDKSEIPESGTGSSGFVKPMLVAPEAQTIELVKPEVPILHIGSSDFGRDSENSVETTATDPEDWRAPLVSYLENPGRIVDRKVRRQALKYILLDNELFH